MSYKPTNQPLYILDRTRLKAMLDTLKVLYGTDGVGTMVNDWLNELDEDDIFRFDYVGKATELEKSDYRYSKVGCQICGKTLFLSGKKVNKSHQYCSKCYHHMFPTECIGCNVPLKDGEAWGKGELDYCEHCYSDMFVPWGKKK